MPGFANIPPITLNVGIFLIENDGIMHNVIEILDFLQIN
jgi:hypothetical protein